jgi:hypothetical protein
MHQSRGADKGTPGEQAVFSICEEIYQRCGGLLYHSYAYKCDPDLPGNIKKGENGHLFVERTGSFTELDVLLITPYRVFPIEVKAYRAREIILTDDGMSGAAHNDKSPVHQNEMHCRHLYPHLYKVLPKGETKYIIPMVCFVDKCTIRDNRSTEQRDYIKMTVLNTLGKDIMQLNRPGEYLLNLQTISQVLKDAEVSSSVSLQLRIIG